MKQSAVVQLNQSSVMSHIQMFLDRKGSKSASTRMAYEKDAADFFMATRNKHMNELAVDDLVYTVAEVDRYNLMLNDRFKGGTVNRKMSAIRSLMKYLNRAGSYQLDLTVFDAESSYVTSESYGVLTYPESQEMARLAKYHRNGDKKSALIQLAVVTSFRVDTLTKLTKNSFKQVDGIWTVVTVGKGGKLDRKAISHEVYEVVKSVMPFDSNTPIFDMTPQTCRNMMAKLCEEMNIPENRNIKFHSLKKCGVNEVYMLTGHDTLKAQKQGAHQNIATTERYLEKNEDLKNAPSLMIGKELDFTVLEEMTKDDLVAVLKGMDRAFQIQLMNRLK